MLLNPLLKWASAGLAFLCLMLATALMIERRQNGKLEGQVIRLSAELQRISTERDEQNVVTRDRIVVAERERKEADRVAERIETAPVAPECRTPEVILQSDL